MSTAAHKTLSISAPPPDEGFRDRSGERSQPAKDAPARAPEIRAVATPAPLVLSIESTERLRQMLKTESLTSEGQLITLVKDALAFQYLRGVNEGVVQAGKDPARLPSRSIPQRPGRADSWELHRRAQRNGKIRNVLATMVILGLAAAGLITMGMIRPTLSNDSPQAIESNR